MPAMDPKIMAAVFASVAAIAIGTGGSGSLEDLKISDPGEIIGDRFNPSDILSGTNDRNVPNTTVKITAELNANSTGMKVNSKKIIFRNYQKIVLGPDNISSDDYVTVNDFQGVLTLNQKDNLTGVRGSSNGFRSSGVLVSGERDIEGFTDSENFEIINNSVEKLTLKDVDASIKSVEDSTLIEKDNSNLRLEKFRGNTTVFDENNTVIFKGIVTKAEADGASLSS